MSLCGSGPLLLCEYLFFFHLFILLAQVACLSPGFPGASVGLNLFKKKNMFCCDYYCSRFILNVLLMGCQTFYFLNVIICYFFILMAFQYFIIVKTNVQFLFNVLTGIQS